MIVFTEKSAQLFDPHRPLWIQQPFLEIPLEQFYAEIANPVELMKIIEINQKVFLILEKSWQLLNYKLVDFKLEYARLLNGEIVLADVIDSDSWRKLDLTGQYSDKQVYREGGSLGKVGEKFREAAELSARFEIPRQQVIIWTGP